jgi:hypothetical protein
MRKRIETLPVASLRHIANETPFVALIRAIQRADETEMVRQAEREVRRRLKGRRR